MGLEISIGQACVHWSEDNIFLKVDTIYQSNAPKNDSIESGTNERSPNRDYWKPFMQFVGIEEFLLERTMIPVTPERVSEIKLKISQYRQRSAKIEDHERGWIEWIEYWIEWALMNCDKPVIWIH